MTTYTDLFEDEISEILNESSENAYIYTNNGNTSYRKTFCVNYDGFLVHENKMYIRYDFGKRSCVVPEYFLIARLAHDEFSVLEDK